MAAAARGPLGPPLGLLLAGLALALSAVIKRPCSYDTDCPQHAFCRLQQECSCKDDYFVAVDAQRSETCVKRVHALGEECLQSDQCQLALGLAAECGPAGVCSCRPGAHETDGRCYNTSPAGCGCAGVGERCASDRNCWVGPVTQLSCDSGRCECPRLQHGAPDGSRCIDSLGLGESCERDEQCVDSGSRCSDQHCACDLHHVPSPGVKRCLRVADAVGDLCEEEVQCARDVLSSWCERGVCSCRPGTHAGPRGRRCWRTSYLGDGCEQDEECAVTPPGEQPQGNASRARCLFSRCRCVEGFFPDESGRYCLAGGSSGAAAAARRTEALLAAAVALALTRPWP